MRPFQEYLNEAEGQTTHYLIKMSKNGDDRHFVVDYSKGPGQAGEPLALKRTIDQDDRVEELRAQGYSYPSVVASWQGDIDEQIKLYRERAESWADRREEYPTQYYSAVRNAEELERAKQLMSGGMQEEVEEEVEEVQDDCNDILKLAGLTK